MHKSTLCLTGLGIMVWSGLAAAQSWNHDPNSPIGPLFWGSITPAFATCGTTVSNQFVEVGKKQTPINIVSAQGVLVTIPALTFGYHPTEMDVENTGHVVEVPYETGSFLFIGPSLTDAYQLVQFHFHAPSEHIVDGVRYDAELHLVHSNALGELAVVGVLLTASSSGLAQFDTIMSNAPLTVGDQDAHVHINALDLLPASKGFYTYTGSLTTPACTESVRWFVLKQTVPITSTALSRLHTVVAAFPGYGGYPNNNRPLVPLNGRTVLKSNDSPPIIWQ